MKTFLKGLHLNQGLNDKRSLLREEEEQGTVYAKALRRKQIRCCSRNREKVREETQAQAGTGS